MWSWNRCEWLSTFSSERERAEKSRCNQNRHSCVYFKSINSESKVETNEIMSNIDNFIVLCLEEVQEIERENCWARIFVTQYYILQCELHQSNPIFKQERAKQILTKLSKSIACNSLLMLRLCTEWIKCETINDLKIKKLWKEWSNNRDQSAHNSKSIETNQMNRNEHCLK